jgi:hypothetical protein
MSENRGHWYLLTGLLIGLALGIAYAWAIAPLEYVDTTPESLRADFKDEYRFLIAFSHRAHGNLERTKARLSLLGDADPVAALGEQAQRMLAGNVEMSRVRILADLAEALQNPAAHSAGPAPATVAALETGALPAQPAQSGPTATIPPTDATSPFEPILEPSETPTFQPSPSPSLSPDPRTRTATPTRTPLRTATPIATATARPSLTPTATPGQPFQLLSQSTFCDARRPGLLQVILQNSAGSPAAGIEIIITWFGGQEEFFTGLKPELGHGYADFVMTPGVEYALSLSNGVTRITGLQAETCSGDYPGGIRLEFRQP